MVIFHLGHPKVSQCITAIVGNMAAAADSLVLSFIVKFGSLKTFFLYFNSSTLFWFCSFKTTSHDIPRNRYIGDLGRDGGNCENALFHPASDIHHYLPMWQRAGPPPVCQPCRRAISLEILALPYWSPPTNQHPWQSPHPLHSMQHQHTPHQRTPSEHLPSPLTAPTSPHAWLHT